MRSVARGVNALGARKGGRDCVRISPYVDMVLGFIRSER